MQTCYRHPDRETGVSCSSCGNPICPDCMIPTPVGMRCPECAKQRTQVRTAATLAGPEPRVTYAIIAINVALFFAQVLTAGGGLRARASSITEQGELVGLYVAQGEWWRIITSGFLHADPFHLILNMVGVWFLGQLLEPAIGSVRFFALYMASLLAGAYGALLLHGDFTRTVGASGAVFGLLGAAFLIARDRGIDPMRSGIGVILLLNILLSFRPGISLGGHLGGLAGGALCAAIIVWAERRRSNELGIAGCVAVAVASAVGAVATAGAV